MKCWKPECGKEAEFIGRVKMWADWKRFGPHPPMEAMAGIPVCGDESHMFTLEDLGPSFVNTVRLAALAARKAEPDMSTAVVERVALTDPAAIEFMKHTRRH